MEKQQGQVVNPGRRAGSAPRVSRAQASLSGAPSAAPCVERRRVDLIVQTGSGAGSVLWSRVYLSFLRPRQEDADRQLNSNRRVSQS